MIFNMEPDPIDRGPTSHTFTALALEFFKCLLKKISRQRHLDFIRSNTSLSIQSRSEMNPLFYAPVIGTRAEGRQQEARG